MITDPLLLLTAAFCVGAATFTYLWLMSILGN
jgi:hypothetical protein